MHAFHGTLCVSNGPTFLVLVALIKSNKVHFDGNGHNQAVNAKKKEEEKEEANSQLEDQTSYPKWSYKCCMMVTLIEPRLE